MRLLAIDPGPTESAYVVIDDNRRPLWFGKVGNEDLRALILTRAEQVEADKAAVEMIASYGMSVGADVFETCCWIGRYCEAYRAVHTAEPWRIKRLPIKVHHCYSAKATDANIRQALTDRFAPGVRNFGKGTKADPGWFHGFRADVWAAYALAVYVADKLDPRPQLDTEPAPF